MAFSFLFFVSLNIHSGFIINRFMAICHPLSYKTHKHGPLSVWIIGLSILISLVLAIIAYSLKLYSKTPGVMKVIKLMAAAFFFMTVTIFVFSYFKIIKEFSEMVSWTFLYSVSLIIIFFLPGNCSQ